MPPRLLEPLVVVDRHDPASGRWVRVVDDGSALAVTVGGTGNRLAADRRTKRRAWRIGTVDGRPEVLSTWPVREVRTDQIGRVVSDLHDDLRHAGGGPADVARMREAAIAVLGCETGDSLEAVLWAAAFPLLAQGVARHHELHAVPPALIPLLRAETARAGVRALLGRTTRPLVRAAAQRLLVAGDEPIFDPLVLAAMAVGTCGPEQLTEIISSEPARPGSVAFSVADVDRARSMFVGLRGRAVTMTLCAALAEPDGLRQLAAQLSEWNPPRARSRAAVATPPRTERGPQAGTSLSGSGDPGARPVEYPAVWRAVEGRRLADHTVVLPRRGNDLLHWGRVLDNCLGTFRYAVADGRSRILGLVRDRQLRYAVEVTPGGTIRQIEGTKNTRPDRERGNGIARGVIDLGLADCDGRTGASLVAPPPA